MQHLTTPVRCGSFLQPVSAIV